MLFLEERIGEILKQLSVLRYRHELPIGGWECREVNKDLTDNENKVWSYITEDYLWGGKERSYYEFRTTFTIPEIMKGNRIELHLSTGREGEWDAINPQFLAYVNGKLKQGVDVNHTDITLTECAQANEQYDIYLSAFSGNHDNKVYLSSTIRTVDQEIEEFYYDCLVPWQVIGLLDIQDTDYIKVSQILRDTLNLLDFRQEYSDEFFHSMSKAREYLHEKLYHHSDNHDEVTVWCVGHTHIDVAWLWTLDVTRDKALRSFSTVLELMKQYPEYIFMSSQPQLYKYVKEQNPEVFEQIKQRVNEGRWEAEGGMFVEPDCNLSNGESLIRQFLYGKRFFKDEFNVDNTILWLPDVFGYSAALPQILLKCGIKYFMTTKISWNETNQMPFDTFMWEGIDGSRVLSHFITTRDYYNPKRNICSNKEHRTAFSTNYNGYIVPSQIKGAWQRYQQKDLNKDILVSYGYGDGGGGPSKEMLETQRRLAKGIPGCPRTKQASALEFFEKLKENLTEKEVPIWTGELYLEYHRGTYTSMSKNKKYNREGEIKIVNTEFYGMLSKLLCGRAYNKELIRKQWEILMRNQFHDILPGSSIKEVYDDSHKEYEQMFNSLKMESEDALQRIADNITGSKNSLILFNSNDFYYKGIVTIPREVASEIHFDDNAIQNSNTRDVLIYSEIPPKGYCVWEAVAVESSNSSTFCSTKRIENQFYRIELDKVGHFISYYDKLEKRELLPRNKKANILMTYEDKPHNYDNWNIYEYYRDKKWEVNDLISSEVIENGPLRFAVRFIYKYLSSTITETIYSYPFQNKIDLDFDIDWNESQILLKLLFPFDINTHEATFDIQYGNVKRSTAKNTSWDQARFEVCYHKWMDISDGGYGVSIINDCKYGVSIYDNCVELTLLKAGLYPNPKADKGHHEFSYAICPHKGTWLDAEIPIEAYKFNNPIVARKKKEDGNNLPRLYSLVQSSEKNVMIEVVKEAEDDNSMVLRLYEFGNMRTFSNLDFGFMFKRVEICNMLEEFEELTAVNERECVIEMKPYEIKTIKVYF